MKNCTSELQKRIEHFRWVEQKISSSSEELYLEKDWYDNPTLITKEDAKKEIEQAELELFQKKSKSIWQSMRRLFRR
ncbi:TPA: hypothetical protein TT573_000571 [Streptococcus equi subsp. zooepidemicus]|nr:hypothetical protein [Streptococcus equi subsp. zooepidemicus]